MSAPRIDPVEWIVSAEERLHAQDRELAQRTEAVEEARVARDHVAELAATLEQVEADKDRALELIRRHVADIDNERARATALEAEVTAERTKVTTLTEGLEAVRTERDQAIGRARTLNPLFGGPRINDELPDLDTLNVAGVGVRGDRIPFVLWGQELDRETALVMAAHVVAIADRGDGLFAAIYRKVCNA